MTVSGYPLASARNLILLRYRQSGTDNPVSRLGLNAKSLAERPPDDLEPRHIIEIMVEMAFLQFNCDK